MRHLSCTSFVSPKNQIDSSVPILNNIHLTSNYLGLNVRNVNHQIYPVYSILPSLRQGLPSYLENVLGVSPGLGMCSKSPSSQHRTKPSVKPLRCSQTLRISSDSSSVMELSTAAFEMVDRRSANCCTISFVAGTTSKPSSQKLFGFRTK